MAKCSYFLQLISRRKSIFIFCYFLLIILYNNFQLDDCMKNKAAIILPGQIYEFEESSDNMSYIIELYNFPDTFKTYHLLNIYKEGPRYIKWCDSSHCLLVCNNFEQGINMLKIIDKKCCIFNFFSQQSPRNKPSNGQVKTPASCKSFVDSNSLQVYFRTSLEKTKRICSKTKKQINIAR